MQSHDEPISPTVTIDGITVKRIREKRDLTQLYIATVVGVTPDTISRWEKKSSANIRHENAVNLARALEVDIDSIITSQIETAEHQKPSRRAIHLIIGIITFSLTGYFLTSHFLYDKSGNQYSTTMEITREAPLHGSPGSTIPVRIHIDHSEPDSSMVITEHFPKSWQLLESDPPASSLDNINGIARWMLKSKSQAISIDYLLRISLDSHINTKGLFSGSITAGTYQKRAPLEIPESKPITITQLHWADRDGNYIIDDAEVLDAFDLYDEMQGVHINWDLIEKIWDAGTYRWDEEKKDFIVPSN